MSPERRRWQVVAAVLALALVAAPGPASAGATDARPVKVMTRNLYLGADLTSALTAGSLEELALRTTQTFRTVMATNFPERARALALEISEAEPDLVGLQEVSLYRTGEPGVLDGPATPATTVIQDFLTILQQELQSAGLQYSPAIVLEESDVETPSTLGYDIRLTQRDVILARDGVVTSNAQGAHFTVNLEVPTVAGPLTVFRGWASVDATVHQRTVRFVTTHLEAFSPVHRFFQALELALPGGPAFTTLPVVLVGDLNSGPHEEDPLSAYGLLTSAGFSDTWTAVHPDDPGFTCCYAENLRDPEPVLSERIDHVLARLGIEALRAKLVGVDPDARTPSGLWPSDHAGIVTTLTP